MSLSDNDWEYIFEPIGDAAAVQINLPSRVVKRADGVVENEYGTPLFRMVCVAKPAPPGFVVQPLRELEADVPKEPPKKMTPSRKSYSYGGMPQDPVSSWCKASFGTCLGAADVLECDAERMERSGLPPGVVKWKREVAELLRGIGEGKAVG